MTEEEMADTAAQAAADKADLLLYPETVSQDGVANGERLLGLLGALAAKYGMYTAASIFITDKKDGRNYNRGVLHDRQGKPAGVYDKIHPYSPEVTHRNISPGQKTDVFKTDFGTVGMIICYDSWFTDVTALMALKGAEVILFPVAGYYRSLIPARAADNQVRFVISVL
ncbi:MAG: carbon-nitrogen hydrolase family protein, partial [Treponema sp.]|nr:carbon-nitrogen hydrolase family protein [Treponema sp.]